MTGGAGKRHADCYFCGPGGYLFSDWKHTDTGVRARMKIERRHEGWPDIPHGGVGMTSIIELADLADRSLTGAQQIDDAQTTALGEGDERLEHARAVCED